jgi:hypothetical protein
VRRRAAPSRFRVRALSRVLVLPASVAISTSKRTNRPIRIPSVDRRCLAGAARLEARARRRRSVIRCGGRRGDRRVSAAPGLRRWDCRRCRLQRTPTARRLRPLRDPAYFARVAVDQEAGTIGGPTASTCHPSRWSPVRKRRSTSRRPWKGARYAQR